MLTENAFHEFVELLAMHFQGRKNRLKTCATILGTICMGYDIVILHSEKIKLVERERKKKTPSVV